MRNLIGLLLIATLNAPVLAENLTLSDMPTKKIPKHSTKQSNTGQKSKTTKSTTNTLQEFSFENGTIPTDWDNDGWEFTSEFSTDGDYSIKTSTGTVVWNTTFAEGYLNFNIKSIGDDQDIRISGYELKMRLYNEDWRTYSVNISEGTSSISFKNDPWHSNEDPTALYIDNVIYIVKDQDNDNDGIEDQWEFENDLDYHNANDANLDPDEDGLTNLQEYQKGTDPNYYDSDGDDVNDSQDSEPLDPNVQ